MSEHTVPTHLAESARGVGRRLPTTEHQRGLHAAAATRRRDVQAHPLLVDHSDLFEAHIEQVSDRVFCLCGYGLANTTVVVGDGGLVVIDTGESIEEGRILLEDIRTFTDVPVAGVVYTHFHYVGGTAAFLDKHAPGAVPVWGHERVDGSRARVAAEIGPAFLRRLACQFGLLLPSSGPDAMPNLGIGPTFFSPIAADRTDGYVAPTHLISGPVDFEIAGVRFQALPAPSDSDDTVILWLPDDDVIVNNHVWPALFNIYPLRGEPYRDPLVHIEGLDQIASLGASHLVGVHGPPIHGAVEVADAVRTYRDAIAFLWDQTVRGLNQRRSPEELAAQIELPARFGRHPLTQQVYGLAEFHVRQIANGLFGWFDEDVSNALNVAPQREATLLVDALGGRERVVELAEQALDAGDDAWSARLATYLLWLDPSDGDARRIKANALRSVAATTTSANLRSFALTHAHELEGQLDLGMFSPAVVPREWILAAPPGTFVHALRVQVDPGRAAGVDLRVAVVITDHDARFDLHLYDGLLSVSDSADGAGRNEQRPAPTLRVSLASWADLYLRRATLDEMVADGRATVDPGSPDDLRRAFSAFDHTTLT